MKERIKLFQIAGVIALMLGMLFFSGCNDEDDPDLREAQIERVSIYPEVASFAVGDQLDFSTFVITNTGDTIDTEDIDIEWEWWSTDTTVFTVEEGGRATGQNPGEAYCVIEATIQEDTDAQLKALALFTGRDSAFVSVLAF